MLNNINQAQNFMAYEITPNENMPKKKSRFIKSYVLTLAIISLYIFSSQSIFTIVECEHLLFVVKEKLTILYYS